jgi:ribosomal protein L32E
VFVNSASIIKGYDKSPASEPKFETPNKMYGFLPSGLSSVEIHAWTIGVVVERMK